MQNSVFDDCMKTQKELSGKNVPFWGDLAKKHGYSSGENLRSDYRREAKRRGYVLSDLKEKNGGPKVLIFDLETTPMLRWAFSLHEEHASPKTIVRDWHLLSYSAQWLFEDDVFAEVLTPKEIKAVDDSRLARSMWELIDNADIAVAYNGTNFDFKRLNTRFLKHGLLPPSHFLTVDPILTARSVFDFSSNSMDYVAEFLEHDKKIHTDFSLWSSCMDGNLESLENMLEYNVQDIKVLESLYLSLLPYMKNHPNMNLFYEDNVQRCRQCGSEKIIEIPKKVYRTLTNAYGLYRCTNCGYSGRFRESVLTKEKRKSIAM